MKQFVLRLLISLFATEKMHGPNGTIVYRVESPGQSRWVRKILEAAMLQTYLSVFTLPPEQGLSVATTMHGLPPHVESGERRETWVVCTYTQIVATFAQRILEGPRGTIWYNFARLVSPAGQGKGLAKWVIKRAKEVHNIRFVLGRSVNPGAIASTFAVVNYQYKLCIPFPSEANNDLRTATFWLVENVEGYEFGSHEGQFNIGTCVLNRGVQPYMQYVPPRPGSKMAGLFSSISFNETEANAGSVIYYGADLSIG